METEKMRPESKQTLLISSISIHNRTKSESRAASLGASGLKPNQSMSKQISDEARLITAGASVSPF